MTIVGDSKESALERKWWEWVKNDYLGWQLKIEGIGDGLFSQPHNYKGLRSTGTWEDPEHVLLLAFSVLSETYDEMTMTIR